MGAVAEFETERIGRPGWPHFRVCRVSVAGTAALVTMRATSKGRPQERESLRVSEGEGGGGCSEGPRVPEGEGREGKMVGTGEDRRDFSSARPEQHTGQ